MPERSCHIGIHVGHDSNICVIDSGGTILFAAGEERFNRQKMYAGFPRMALQYAVEHWDGFATMSVTRMNAVAKAVRELGFFLNSFKKGLAAPRFGIWLKNGALKLVRGRAFEQERAAGSGLPDVPMLNVEHHHAHAASALYPSGFTSGFVMTLDGEGDGYSCCIYRVESGTLHRIKALYHNEMTVGRDYEKVTAMLGFHPLRHPGKITGLAAFGEFNGGCVGKLEKYLKDSWKIDRYRVLSTAHAYQVISPEGRSRLLEDRRNLFGEFKSADMAYAIQYLTEQKVLDLIRKTIHPIEGSDIALAGGVFANVSLNKKVKELGFGRIFIQPAMTDAGLSLGSVLYSRPETHSMTPFSRVYFGPSYSADNIRADLDRSGMKYEIPGNLPEKAAEMLADGNVVARFDGPMEFGPRALGNRSILYRADDPTVNDWLNKKLRRTEFMPFAPVTLYRFAGEYYRNLDGAENPARFMTITFDCTEKMKRESPAVVHVDGTARPQLIDLDDNPGYVAILEEYYRMTGVPTLINTSFNMHEEPIVMTPDDAIRAFRAGGLDALLIGPFLVRNT